MAIYMGLDSSTQSLTAVVIEADGRDRQVLKNISEIKRNNIPETAGPARPARVCHFGTGCLRTPIHWWPIPIR